MLAMSDYGWAAGPECISAVMACPGPIAELGSGASTRAFEAAGRWVLSIEHDMNWLLPRGTLCPLVNGWYDVDKLAHALATFTRYGVLFVDGPVGSEDRCRFHAHAWMFRHDVPWIFDDVSRAPELAMVKALSEETGRAYDVVEVGKPFAILEAVG